jgi:hypothetical protein
MTSGLFGCCCRSVASCGAPSRSRTAIRCCGRLTHRCPTSARSKSRGARERTDGDDIKNRGSGGCPALARAIGRLTYGRRPALALPVRHGHWRGQGTVPLRGRGIFNYFNILYAEDKVRAAIGPHVNGSGDTTSPPGERTPCPPLPRLYRWGWDTKFSPTSAKRKR